MTSFAAASLASSTSILGDITVGKARQLGILKADQAADVGEETPLKGLGASAAFGPELLDAVGLADAGLTANEFLARLMLHPDAERVTELVAATQAALGPNAAHALCTLASDALARTLSPAVRRVLAQVPIEGNYGTAIDPAGIRSPALRSAARAVKAFWNLSGTDCATDAVSIHEVALALDAFDSSDSSQQQRLAEAQADAPNLCREDVAAIYEYLREGKTESGVGLLVAYQLLLKNGRSGARRIDCYPVIDGRDAIVGTEQERATALLTQAARFASMSRVTNMDTIVLVCPRTQQLYLAAGGRGDLRELRDSVQAVDPDTGIAATTLRVISKDDPVNSLRAALRGSLSLFDRAVEADVQQLHQSAGRGTAALADAAHTLLRSLAFRSSALAGALAGASTALAEETRALEMMSRSLDFVISLDPFVVGLTVAILTPFIVQLARRYLRRTSIAPLETAAGLTTTR